MPNPLVDLINAGSQNTFQLVIRGRVAARMDDPQDGVPRFALPRLALGVDDLVDMNDLLTRGTLRPLTSSSLTSV